MNIEQIVMKEIRESIKELSDLDFQRKLWLNENNDTGLISSYAELITTLFDGLEFDNFIDEQAIKMGISSEIIDELNEIRILLDNYEEKPTDKEIIDDPKWKEISQRAEKVIQKWEDNSLE